MGCSSCKIKEIETNYKNQLKSESNEENENIEKKRNKNKIKLKILEEKKEKNGQNKNIVNTIEEKRENDKEKNGENEEEIKIDLFPENLPRKNLEKKSCKKISYPKKH